VYIKMDDSGDGEYIPHWMTTLLGTCINAVNATDFESCIVDIFNVTCVPDTTTSLSTTTTSTTSSTTSTTSLSTSTTNASTTTSTTSHDTTTSFTLPTTTHVQCQSVNVIEDSPWSVASIFVALVLMAIFAIWIGNGNRPKIHHDSLIQSFLDEEELRKPDTIPANGVADDPYADDGALNSNRYSNHNDRK